MCVRTSGRKTHRRAPSTNRIPALLRREPSRIAPNRRPTCDIRECLEPTGVQPGVEEPQRGFAGRNKRVVDECDDCAGSGGRAARPVKQDISAIPSDDVVKALGGDVRVRAAVGVEQALERAFERGDVLGDDGVLVPGAREVGGEAAAGREAVFGIEGDDLGGVVHGCADGGYVGTCGGEFGEEGGGVFAVVGDATAGDILLLWFSWLRIYYFLHRS